MDLFCHFRRYSRLVTLCLIAMILLKMLFCCTVFDVLLLMGLIAILLALASSSW